MTFGQYLKSLMKKQGLKQVPLAKIAGVSQSVISKVVNDKLDPSYALIMAVYRMDPKGFDQFARIQ